MSRSELTRQSVHHHLHDTITALVSCIADISEAELLSIPITPEWSALDILRHISVWGELSRRTLTNWHGQQNWILREARLDDFNAEMVAERAHTHLTEIMETIMVAYQQYASTLLDCTDVELLERTTAPWDQELNRLELIYGALGHDRSHIRELQQALQQRS